jgi:cysteine desulfuration protein SufE
MSLAERQATLVQRYSIIPDPQERLAVIISRSNKAGTLPEEARIESNRVPGCVSRVWMTPTLTEGKCHFPSDADSPLVKGLVALLCELHEGVTPAEITSFEPTLLEELGIMRNLSPTRINGLRSVREAIRSFAASHLPATA